MTADLNGKKQSQFSRGCEIREPFDFLVGVCGNTQVCASGTFKV